MDLALGFETGGAVSEIEHDLCVFWTIVSCDAGLDARPNIAPMPFLLLLWVGGRHTVVKSRALCGIGVVLRRIDSPRHHILDRFSIGRHLAKQAVVVRAL